MNSDTISRPHFEALEKEYIEEQCFIYKSRMYVGFLAKDKINTLREELIKEEKKNNSKKND